MLSPKPRVHPVLPFIGIRLRDMSHWRNPMRHFLIAAALAASVTTMATATSATPANEALPPAVAQQLDTLRIEFTASAAKRERMMIIQQNMEAQRRYGRSGNRGYGYGGGYDRGYGPRPGYGPQPYGYGRPRYDRW